VPGALEALWDVLVEQGLFVSGSHQRRYLGFRIFATLLPLATAPAIPALFSPGFVRCLLNNLNKPDNYLHAAAADCLDQIVAYAKVGRCRLTPGTPWFSQLTPRMLSGTFSS